MNKQTTLLINGKEFTTNIVNINIVYNKLKIDKEILELPIDKIIDGNIKNLSVDHCSKMSVKGNIDFINTNNGDIIVDGGILGNVETRSGNVTVKQIIGHILTRSGKIK